MSYRLGCLLPSALFACAAVLACGPTSEDAKPAKQVVASPVIVQPKPTRVTAPVQEDVYYENCSAARDAGAAPIRRGQPGYRAALDRDDDGIACE